MAHSKQTKKGKNPIIVDSWLDTLGYFRKNIAFDETCLFRAVAEQIYATQLTHEEMRRKCVVYATNNCERFVRLAGGRRELFDHLDKLSTHMAVSTELELHIISDCYKYNVVVFDGINQTRRNVTGEVYDRDILLCRTSVDHYDSVYKKEYIAASGFCQSIVYTIVYENVLMIPDVQSIVQSMLYDKVLANNNNNDYDEESADTKNSKAIAYNKYGSGLAPFPYKVAKALDPLIYRNIEYDTWIEMRKEIRLGDWYHGDDNLTLGTRCKLKSGDETVLCYLQKFIREENKCVVYVTSLAEKKIVDYVDLSPEDDAKPWPLPYRFRKNQAVLPLPAPESTDKPNRDAKPCKKKKEKNKQGKNSSENALSLNIPSSNSVQLSASLYEGCPLQIQKSPRKLEPEASTAADDVPALQEVPSSCWEPDRGSPSFDAINCSKPAMQSFTPDGWSDPDQCVYYGVPQYYNWQDNNAVNQMTPTTMMMSSQSPMETEPVASQSDRFNYVYCNENRMPPVYPNQSATIVTPVPETPLYPFALSPVFEMYHSPPVYNQPISPMIYVPHENAHAEPVPVSMYGSPAIAYVYPQTATPTWYPHSINSHGFVFPPTPVTSPPNVANRY